MINKLYFIFKDAIFLSMEATNNKTKEEYMRREYNKPYSVGDIVWSEWCEGVSAIGGYFYDRFEIKPSYINEIAIEDRCILIGVGMHPLGHAEAYLRTSEVYKTFSDARLKLGISHASNISELRFQDWQNNQDDVRAYKKRKKHELKSIYKDTV